ncbi:MAG: pentapeptide repeat-containing protein [Magnetovibrio sp.]|nr:pentapeptide repeat-containing protein [Magnetovibrio sp.]
MPDAPKIEVDEFGQRFLPLEEALMLARQEHKVWNEWSDHPDHKGVRADFSHYDFSDDPINFRLFHFTGPVIFTHCTFYEADFLAAIFSGLVANFSGVTFSGREANFYGAEFSGANAYFGKTEFSGGRADFAGAQFKKAANFYGAKFLHDADFQRAHFESAAVFTDTTFQHVPDFRYTNPKVHFPYMVWILSLSPGQKRTFY